MRPLDEYFICSFPVEIGYNKDRSDWRKEALYGSYHLMGKAGSGKSSQCFKELQAWEAEGGKAMLLVPDQATYGAERRLAEHAKGQGFVGTQVVGFSRLAYNVFQEQGLSHASLSEFARKIILQRLLHKGEKDFSLLQTAARQPNFADTAGRFLGECRSFCVSPDALRKAAEAVSSTTLSHKLQDMALLYDMYQAFLSDHFGSADDTMTLLAKTVDKDPFCRAPAFGSMASNGLRRSR